MHEGTTALLRIMMQGHWCYNSSWHSGENSSWQDDYSGDTFVKSSRKRQPNTVLKKSLPLMGPWLPTRACVSCWHALVQSGQYVTCSSWWSGESLEHVKTAPGVIVQIYSHNLKLLFQWNMWKHYYASRFKYALITCTYFDGTCGNSTRHPGSNIFS